MCGFGLLWRYRFEYVLPAGPDVVYGFFRNTENMGKVWPAELGMRVVSREGDVYTVGFRLLGQFFTARFRIQELPGLKQHHETLDFPFGRLEHTISVEPSDSGSLVVEEMMLRSRNPFAGRFFRKILQYRAQAIKHSFGVAEKPVYRDPFRISLAAGSLMSVAGTVAAYALLFLQPFSFTGGRFIAGIIAFMLLWFFTHDIAHYVVGRIVGIRFSNYYIGLSNIVRLAVIPKPFRTLPIALGLKIDRQASRATPRGYAAMYTAGPLASMLTPLTVPLTMLSTNPSSIAGLLLLAFAAANIIFTAVFSPKAGCLAKARKAIHKNRRQK